MIKAEYDKGTPCSFYEYRDPSLPCNLHVDIDSSAPSKEEHDEDDFLKQVRADFDAAGIKEPWKLQTSSGESNGKYKVSYHITIPGVEDSCSIERNNTLEVYDARRLMRKR